MTLFGIGGLILHYWWAAGALVPVAAVGAALYLGRPVLDIVKGVIGFLTDTTIGRTIVGAGVAYFIASGLWQWGADYTKEQCDAAELRTQLAQARAESDHLRRQLEASSEIQKADARRAAAAEEQLRQNERSVNDTPKNDNSCLDRDAAGRVRGIR